MCPGIQCPGDERRDATGDAKLAVRSQYWMLGVMVGFTSLALWLLAQAGS